MTSAFFDKDPILEKFLCLLITHGKKNTAKKIIKTCGTILQKQWGLNPKETFHQAIHNTKPALEVHSVKKGGTSYQVPVPMHPDRRVSLAIRWILQSARKRKEPSIALKLAHEIHLAANRQGQAIERRNQVHAVAEANRAFTHLRWK